MHQFGVRLLSQTTYLFFVLGASSASQSFRATEAYPTTPNQNYGHTFVQKRLELDESPLRSQSTTIKSMIPEMKINEITITNTNSFFTPYLSYRYQLTHSHPSRFRAIKPLLLYTPLKQTSALYFKQMAKRFDVESLEKVFVETSV